MADKKISALTSAALPLAGTEVLPIVQSGATVKVASDDLTVKNVRSNATTGILQIAGPGAGETRTMTTPNANFTAARTDAAQSLTGDQTLSTGNLIQGTAAKGVNFTANTPAAGMTSQLLNNYEEGTYSPTITFSGGGSVTLNASLKTLSYTRVGRLVTVTGYLLVSSVSSPTGYMILTLPFSSKSGDAFSYSGSLIVSGTVSVPANGFGLLGLQNSGVAWVFLSNATTLGTAVGQQLQANSEFRINFSYVAA